LAIDSARSRGQTREEPDDCRRDPRLQLHITRCAPLGVAFASAGSRFVIGQTLRLRLAQGLLLNQHALPLVAPPCAAETDNDG
jgi:hypothetical protein